MFLKRRLKTDALNEELNIMPVLDILSTLVVFLLLTAVWYQVGSFKTEQGLASQAKGNKVRPTLIGTFTSPNEVTIELKDLTRSNLKVQKRRTFILGHQSTQSEIFDYLNSAKKQIPELTDSIVIPSEKSSYENVIFIMDQINKAGIKNIGLGYRGS
jgi:biopolymer transport protein ExbD